MATLLASLIEPGYDLALGKRRLPVRRFPSKLCAALDSSRRLRMDGKPLSISPNDLHSFLGTEAAPIVIDVRRSADFANAETLIVSAVHHPSD